MRYCFTGLTRNCQDQFTTILFSSDAHDLSGWCTRRVKVSHISLQVNFEPYLHKPPKDILDRPKLSCARALVTIKQNGEELMILELSPAFFSSIILLF